MLLFLFCCVKLNCTTICDFKDKTLNTYEFYDKIKLQMSMRPWKDDKYEI